MHIIVLRTAIEIETFLMRAYYYCVSNQIMDCIRTKYHFNISVMFT